MEGPQEAADIHLRALSLGQNLALRRETCLEKEMVRSKVTPRKVGVGLKRRGESPKDKVWVQVEIDGDPSKKRGLALACIEWETPFGGTALQLMQSSLRCL